MISDRPRGLVRAIAIGVIRDRDRLFVAEGHDVVTGEIFYRPLGGSIEFGETGAEAVEREFVEESELPVTRPKYIGALENLFTNDGRPGHEVVLVYETDFQDERVVGMEAVVCREGNGIPFTARWMPLETFRAGDLPLYPDGLLEMIDHKESRVG
jgi:8-oxo-dGTP pyrophosphatase MutT (NUDIX family)